ncbi:MAG: ABC-F family ATP-binding cassette domain-containing protein [Ruminococcaceae bacterium]|nr:ABC-F family ATP-binding cassette domain-containing protein [Oscillospiraceae bacterium]
MLLSAENISKNYGLKQLLKDATLHVDERQKIGVIGLNGTGKSTFLKILAGLEYPDEGTVTMRRNAQVSYLPQTPVMDDNATVLEQVFADMPEDFRQLNEYEVKSMLTKLGITDFDAKTGTLSGGQRKRVALASALIHPADVLILDEPTNHLDAEMTAWLEDRLKKFTGGIVMVTHDRYFLQRIVTGIVELYRSKLYFYESNYSTYLELKAQRYDMALASERKRQAILRVETAWISRGCRARSTKSRERIERYNALLEQDAPEADSSVQMVTASSRLGRKLVELEHVSVSYDGKTVLRDFSYNIKRDDRIGIVGKNGAGKSTLLNLISGKLQPTEGSVSTGATVKLGYFSQEGREMDGSLTVYDYICQIANQIKTDEGVVTASRMLEQFLFTTDMQRSKVGSLSGGERRRLYLLGILMEAPNILLLDEPTNDLDIETLTILEDYLTTFPGAVIAVSHDRYFLDKTADTIFEVADGAVTQYVGNYTEYLEKKPKENVQKAVSAAPKAQPQQQKQKKLKFSYMEQREYDTIDVDIAALEEKIADVEAQIEAASSDYVKVMELTGQLEQLQEQLDEKTERWVYLTELAEQISAQ